MEVIDEIEDLPVGETQEVTVDLEPGSYVLICNIYSADEDEAHYTEGMRAALHGRIGSTRVPIDCERAAAGGAFAMGGP